MKIQNHSWTYGMLAGMLLWLFVVIATCSSCAMTQMHANGLPRAPQAQLGSTYLITTWCVDDATYPAIGLGRQSGSAVMVDAHHLLTALHVVQCDAGGSPAVTVTSSNGMRFNAHVQREWEQKDIAQLYVHFELPGLSAQIGAVPPPGAGLCAHVAYPGFGATCGEAVSVSPDRPDSDVEMTMPIQHGNSGGGVYDSAGRLVGIVTRLVPCATSLTESCGGRMSSLAGIL